MAKTNFESLRVYRLAEKLADKIWDIVAGWDQFAKDTVGKQIVRAADSVGANIAEGTGRGSFKDNRRFVKTARASLYETKHWLKRAYKRKLVSREHTEMLRPIFDELAPTLNAYLRSIGKVPKIKTDNEQKATNNDSKSKYDAKPRVDNGPKTTDNGPLTTDNGLLTTDH